MSFDSMVVAPVVQCIRVTDAAHDCLRLSSLAKPQQLFPPEALAQHVWVAANSFPHTDPFVQEPRTLSTLQDSLAAAAAAALLA